MDIRITGAPTGGVVSAIPSKSAAHRILIAAALSGIDLTPYCDGLSRDITATKECLQAMSCRGQEVRRSPEKRDEKRNPDEAGETEQNSPARLFCGESGSTLRFLVPVCGVLGIDADFICEGRLPDRPMEPFLTALAEHGCAVSGRNPKALRGRLRGGDFWLPGNISSQYVTGLLMALPLAREDSRILVEGEPQSRPYIDLTLATLADAGIHISESRESLNREDRSAEKGARTVSCTAFHIPGNQRYQLPEDSLKHIEGDWSNGAFWIVMDAMLRGLAPGTGGREESAQTSDRGTCDPESAVDPAESRFVIRCEGLDPASAQGDRAILHVIRRIESADTMLPMDPGASAGPDISVAGRCGFVELDVADIPDLVPIIAAFACGRPRGAVTHITKAERLRYKESDRLKAVTDVLTALGADITEEPAGLMIRGTGTLRGGSIDSFGDHRIVMMAAAAACIAKEDIVIRGAEAVNKSYPGFFEDYRSLGGHIELIG